MVSSREVSASTPSVCVLSRPASNFFCDAAHICNRKSNQVSEIKDVSYFPLQNYIAYLIMFMNHLSWVCRRKKCKAVMPNNCMCWSQDEKKI